MVNPYYTDDNVTLYHGDCLEVDEWLTADVLVTDPPYGMRHKPRGSYDPATGITHSPRGSESIAGDDSIDLRDAVLRRWYDRPWVVFGTWRLPRPHGTDHRLIWHKTGSPPGPARAAFMLQDEEIYIHGKGFRATSPPLRSVIVTDEMRSGAAGAVAKIGHPTPKPLRLMEILVDRCPLGVIADPFAGSGSTLLAARNQGRRAVGVEIEERYCELIARRLDQICLDLNGGN